jgi:Domain of unknown function DUF83
MPALPSLVASLHAVERVLSAGRGKPTQFIPIHFIFTNKLTKDDRLLLGFDALVLSEALGRDIAVGQIIHGEDHAKLKVKTSALAGEVQKRLEKIAALLSSPTPPDLVLNRHCAECEFQIRCRQLPQPSKLRKPAVRDLRPGVLPLPLQWPEGNRQASQRSIGAITRGTI